MNEHPILFSAPMVRAILEGRKTQTRRALNRNKLYNGFAFDDPRIARACPYGQPGDRLWVRETWQCSAIGKEQKRADWVRYRATDGEEMHWRPSIFMPRWASRLTLEITSVRVERVQEISNRDARAEGVTVPYPGVSHIPNEDGLFEEQYRLCFQSVWDQINAKRGYGWDVNPWVWCISFREAH